MNRYSHSQYICTTVEDAQSAVEDLVWQLQQKLPGVCGMTVNEVVKGGSLGLGTTVPESGRFNVDLVIYSKDIDANEVMHKGYEPWLSRLQQFLEADLEISEHCEFQGTSSHGILFSYDGVEVELLPSPHWGRPGELHTFLQSVQPQKRLRFLAGASKWQVQFFKQHLNQKKDYRRELIKRARAWRDKVWLRTTNGRGRPRSYLISLLVIRAFEEAQKRLGVFSSLSPDTLAWQTTEELKTMVCNHRTLDIYWEQYYSLRQYPTLVPTHPPRILDPANPSNNLYLTGIGGYSAHERVSEYEPGDGDWTAFKKNIHTLDLNKPVQHWLCT